MFSIFRVFLFTLFHWHILLDFLQYSYFTMIFRRAERERVEILLQYGHVWNNVDHSWLRPCYDRNIEICILENPYCSCFALSVWFLNRCPTKTSMALSLSTFDFLMKSSSERGSANEPRTMDIVQRTGGIATTKKDANQRNTESNITRIATAKSRTLGRHIALCGWPAPPRSNKHEAP